MREKTHLQAFRSGECLVKNPYLCFLSNHPPTLMQKDNESGRTPAYRTRMKGERANALYVAILQRLTQGKLYRDPSYGTAQLARDLDTNTRYIAAAVAECSGGNYCALVNGLRLRDACRMLRSPRYAHLTAEEIGLLSGFASRQAFYLAFHRLYKCTPRDFRLAAEKEREEEAAAD